MAKKKDDKMKNVDSKVSKANEKANYTFQQGKMQKQLGADATKLAKDSKKKKK